jgi:hypothetical protein
MRHRITTAAGLALAATASLPSRSAAGTPRRCARPPARFARKLPRIVTREPPYRAPRPRATATAGTGTCLRIDPSGAPRRTTAPGRRARFTNVDGGRRPRAAPTAPCSSGRQRTARASPPSHKRRRERRRHCHTVAIVAGQQSKIFNWRKVGNFQLALTRRGRGSLITASDDADGAPFAAASLSHRGGGNGGLRCRAAPVVFRLGSAAPNGRGSRASRGPRRQFTRGGVPAHPGFAIYPDQSAQSGHHKHGHLP